MSFARVEHSANQIIEFGTSSERWVAYQQVARMLRRHAGDASHHKRDELACKLRVLASWIEQGLLDE